MLVIETVAVPGNLKLVEAEVESPVSEPVHFAPVGQQAILSAASREQTEPCLQQTSDLPMLEHGSYPAGQLLARFNMRKTSYALLFASADCGGENDNVSIDNTVEAKNAAEIHPNTFILAARARVRPLNCI